MFFIIYFFGLVHSIKGKSLEQVFNNQTTFFSHSEKNLYLLQKKAQVEHVCSNYNKSLKLYYDLAQKARLYKKDKYLKEAYLGISTLSLILKKYQNALFFADLIISLCKKDNDYIGIKASLHKIRILILLGRKSQAISLYKNIVFFYKKSHSFLLKGNLILFDQTQESLSKDAPLPKKRIKKIQCGAFSKEKNALKQIQKLQKEGLKPTIQKDTKNLFTIIIKYDNTQNKNSIISKLKRLSIDYFIVKDFE